MTKKETLSQKPKNQEKDKLKEGLKYLGFFSKRIKNILSQKPKK